MILHRIISVGVNCIRYQQGAKVLFSSMFIPELRGSADNDNSSWCFAPVCVSAACTINGPAVKSRSHNASDSSSCLRPLVAIAKIRPRGGPLENHQRHGGRDRRKQRKGMLGDARQGWIERKKKGRTSLIDLESPIVPRSSLLIIPDMVYSQKNGKKIVFLIYIQLHGYYGKLAQWSIGWIVFSLSIFRRWKVLTSVSRMRGIFRYEKYVSNTRGSIVEILLTWLDA